MKILIFLHGTTIMHASAAKVSRKERVKQVEDSAETVRDYASYIPVGNAVQKLKSWQSQGTEIIYLSSHENQEDVNKDVAVLNKYDFPEGEVLWRKDGKQYKDIAEEIRPDVLIEDDCESIGGAKEMTITFIDPEIKKLIKSIPLPEFGGIDHLPDDITKL
ncbi:MAG: hypothetical protein PHS54_06460 [Clostridia bacterium]|nr:hypothetical protein [Clostridia bacterium]